MYEKKSNTSGIMLAAIVMFIVCIPRLKRIDLSVIKAGMYPGIFLFAGFYTQILGQQRTSVSHCAFLTAINVVMIPFLVWIISRKRPAIRTFVVSLMTFAGIAVLSIKPGSIFSVLLGMEALTVNMAVGGAIILISVILMEISYDGK